MVLHFYSTTLRVQIPSLFCVASWGLFRSLEAALFKQFGLPFSGDFRHLQAIEGNLGRAKSFSPKRKKTLAIDTERLRIAHLSLDLLDLAFSWECAQTC